MRLSHVGAARAQHVWQEGARRRRHPPPDHRAKRFGCLFRERLGAKREVLMGLKSLGSPSSRLKHPTWAAACKPSPRAQLWETSLQVTQDLYLKSPSRNQLQENRAAGTRMTSSFPQSCSTGTAPPPRSLWPELGPCYGKTTNFHSHRRLGEGAVPSSASIRCCANCSPAGPQASQLEQIHT